MIGLDKKNLTEFAKQLMQLRYPAVEDNASAAVLLSVRLGIKSLVKYIEDYTGKTS
jgi:hypothetical protein